MTRDALAKVVTTSPAATAGPDIRALAAISPTDVLISAVSNWPTGVFADPLRVEGRAALYSYGFLLRRAAAVRPRCQRFRTRLASARRPTLSAVSSASNLRCPTRWRMAQATARIWVSLRSLKLCFETFAGRTCWAASIRQFTPMTMATPARRRATNACATTAISPTTAFSTGGWASILPALRW